MTDCFLVFFRKIKSIDSGYYGKRRNMIMAKDEYLVTDEPLKALTLFAMPMILGSFFQQVYNMADLVTYIQSPSVNIAFLNPVTCNIGNVFFNLRIFQIQLWHSTIIAKAFEIWNLSPFTLKWQFIDKIPVQIF